jgi:DNA gyrase subunit B/topoisomerase-4 subunit B
MYIGGTGKSGLHHLLWEIVDNSIDEAINGFASKVSVTLHEDLCSVTIRDNGRGIPVDIHPKVGRPALEVILTTLHAGGKFDPGSYITSGGLHGVGSSVVNALSSTLIATIQRDGFEWRQEYKRGNPQTDLEKIRPFRGSGSQIFFRPDEQIFETIEFDPELIIKRIEISAFLNKGLLITFKNEATNKKVSFQYEGGVQDFLAKETKGHSLVINEPFIFSKEDHPRVDVALTWTHNTNERIRSFVNGIPTQDGGTHEQGLKDAVLRSIRSYISTNSISIPRGVKLSSEDIREGLLCICSCFIHEPQFQGQTKDKLNNPELRSQIDSFLRPALENWLLENQSIADALISRMVIAAKARQASRDATAKVRRKSSISRRLNLPGKLADCSSTNPAESELFIVEGDSAGGSAKQGRDRKRQAILPLRGKVLNAEQASLAKILKNNELSDVVRALGCGIGKDFKLEHLRYHKIILLMDADQDGHHIATLMLTFFYRYLRPLIDNGHVFLAQPPLYRINVGKEIYWIGTDKEKDKLLKKLPSRSNPQISRFKGLGEMMPKTLYNTTLNPKKRTLLQVAIPPGTALSTEQTISDLMGKNVQARYEAISNWMELVDNLDT